MTAHAHPNHHAAHSPAAHDHAHHPAHAQAAGGDHAMTAGGREVAPQVSGGDAGVADGADALDNYAGNLPPANSANGANHGDTSQGGAASFV